MSEKLFLKNARQHKLLRKYLSLIFLAVLLTACGNNASSATPPEMPKDEDIFVQTGSPTPEATSTETLVPTKTNTPIPSDTPVPTQVPEPEIIMPMVPWEELIPANFPYRESLLSTFNGQFGYENGLEQSSRGAFGLWCIATEDMVRHNPPIEMTGGDIVTHSIPCQYPGPDGKDHLVLIPALRFNEKERIYQILGFNPVVDNGFDSMLEMSTTGLGKDIGPLRFLESPFGYAGQGSILLVSFKMPDADYTQMPDEDYTQGFLPDSQRELYTPELLAEFARTGNPDLLPHQFLLPESEPFGNRLQAAMNDANN